MSVSNGQTGRVDILLHDGEFARLLQRELADTPGLRAVSSERCAAAYDATFMSLGMSERWGAKPLVEELQVFPPARRTANAVYRRS